MEGRGPGRGQAHKRSDAKLKRSTEAGRHRKTTEEAYEFVTVPDGLMGFVIGNKGTSIKQIQTDSGARIDSDSDQGGFLVRGNEEQRARARELVQQKVAEAQMKNDKRKRFPDQVKKQQGKKSPNQGSWKKLDFIPRKCMGGVIGRNRERLNDIEQKTGATLKVDFQKNTLFIKGSIESQKRAIREIKENVYNLNRQSQRTVRFVHVDVTTQLDRNHEFKLTAPEQLQDACKAGEKPCYKLEPLEDSSQDVEEQDACKDLTGMKKIKEKLRMVLKKIHKEKEEERVIIDIWCHLGHAFVTDVDEGEEEKDYFLSEIKEKLENEKLGWRSKFKGGLEQIEVEHLEKNLPSRAAKEEIRYDFTFYTPSCRYVRVKVWLAQKDAVVQEGDEAASMSFSDAPFNVMTVSSRVLPDEQRDPPDMPRFDMCSQTQQRMTADIFMLSKGCDYRLFIKTCPVGLVPRTPQEEEEDKVLESYLMGMKIEGDQLVLPPVSERPDGFDLFYQRRSLRKIYEYERDEDQFTLLVSKYQEKTVDPTETIASGFDEILIETDIHLHCKEWDRLLEEGTWEPEQIVAKLPTFLQFLRDFQKSVTP